VKYTKTIKVCCGHWETREVAACAPADACAPACAPATRCCRVWVPEIVEKEIECVRYERQTCVKKVPYTVCRMVAEKQTKTCTYKVCRLVEETCTKEVPFKTCRMVAEQVVKRVPYTVCKPVEYQREVTCVRYEVKQVPYTVTRCVPKAVCKQVPVTVCCPSCRCCKPACGCN